MSNDLEVFDKSTLKKTEKRVKEMQENGEIKFPPEYSPSNALKSAWLVLQQTKDKNKQPVLESCTKASVMQALLETITNGLNPGKDQVYYIARGRTLMAQKSYFGWMALAKRVASVVDIRPNLIFEDDELKLVNKKGRQVVEEHITSWENRQKDVVGAYVVITFGDDKPDHYELMTRDEIEQSWAQRQGKDKTKAHKNFSGEMCKKTVISRGCKRIVNSSDDHSLMLNSPEVTPEEAHEAQVEEEIEEEANSEVLDVAEGEVEEVEEEPETVTKGEPFPEDLEEDEKEEDGEDKQQKLVDDKPQSENRPY